MLTEITLGQYFPGNSLIHRLDPRTKILATIIYIIAIFFADTPLSYGILTAFAAGVIMISRLPWLMVLKSLKPIWIIIFFINSYVHRSRRAYYLDLEVLKRDPGGS